LAPEFSTFVHFSETESHGKFQTGDIILKEKSTSNIYGCIMKNSVSGGWRENTTQKALKVLKLIVYTE
jgi:hypothetical protein